MVCKKKCLLSLPFIIFLSILFVILISALCTLFLFKKLDNEGNVIYCFPLISNCQNLNEEKLNGTGKYETGKEEEIPYFIWEQCLNLELDPCDNFYQYSCSKYDKSKQDNVQNSSFLYNLADDQIDKCFLATFYGKKSNSSSAIQKMRRYQKEYDRTEGISEEVSVSKLIDEIKSIGSCPALSFKKPQNNNVIDMLLKMTNLTGNSYLYQIYPIYFEVESYQPTIHPAGLIFSNPSAILKTYPNDSKNQTKFNKEEKIREFFAQIFELVAKNVEEIGKEEKLSDVDERSGSGQDNYHEDYNGKNYTEIAQKLVDFELRLLSIYSKWNYFNWDASGYEHFYLDRRQFKQRFEIFDIERYLFENARISPKFNEYLYENEYNVGNRPFYFQSNFTDELSEFYQNLEDGILEDYLCLRFIIDRMPYLDEEFKKLGREFDKNFEGEINRILPKYNEDTIDHIESLFRLPSDHLYVTHCQSNPKQLGKTREIAKNVLDASIKLVEKAEWLDDISRENALKKLNTTLIFIGAPEIALNQTKLDEMYEKLDFKDSDSFMEMARKLRLFNSWHHLSVLHEYENYANFKMLERRARYNNAYAGKQYNYIYLPLGGLFPPNFDVDQPYSNGYGTIGEVAGHELFHLLDTKGSKYLFDTTYQSIFNDSETEAEFKDRTTCLERQYSRQKDDISGLNLNGLQTLDENISDGGGIQASYYAYLEHLKREGGDEKVSGYSQYTHQQSFFISFAVGQCASISLADRKWIINDLQHTLPKHRINTVLRNFPAFSRAFNCSIGTKMNPRKKCKVWKRKK